jgi:hypothetical protein
MSDCCEWCGVFDGHVRHCPVPQLHEREAQVAVMREALEGYLDTCGPLWPNDDGLCGCECCVPARKALSTTPPAALDGLLAKARREALEEAISVIFEECQPNNGAIFSRVDDRIRALADAKEGA